MKGVTYFTETGEIDGVVSVNVPADLAMQARPERGIGVLAIDEPLEGVFKNYYVFGGSLVEKAHFTLDTIPLPATATIEGEQHPITELPVTFEFDTPGTYTISVDAGPAYYVEEFQIDYPA